MGGSHSDLDTAVTSKTGTIVPSLVSVGQIYSLRIIHIYSGYIIL